MLYRIILLFTLLFDLSITKEIDVYKLPFVISKSGAMIITDHEEKMSLSSDLLLTHKDILCTTKIDLKRPTEAEIKAKSGKRKVFQHCKNETKIEKPRKEVPKKSVKK
uniref:Secreted protein n=2 Tax=Schistosoma mansoni TaxID=6183 RepID=A0A5K4FCR3_SCHMA